MVVSEIDAHELKTRLDAGELIEVIDVRSDAEVAQGVLPQAMHLPMHLIPMRMHDLPRDKEIIIYCRSGARSYQTCAYLRQNGVDNVVNLRGGIIGWAQRGFEIRAA